MIRTSAQRHKANTSSDQQHPPTIANPVANFTVDWSPDVCDDEGVWEDEIYLSSTPVPESTSSSSSDESEDDEWDGLEEFTEAEEALYQSNGLNPPMEDSLTDTTTVVHLNDLALNSPSKEEISSTDTTSEPETFDLTPAQAVSLAQQVLVGLAIDPDRPGRPRKDFVTRPSPLRNQVKFYTEQTQWEEDQAGSRGYAPTDGSAE